MKDWSDLLIKLTDRSRRVLAHAQDCSTKQGQLLCSYHLLWGIAKYPGSVAYVALENCNALPEGIQRVTGSWVEHQTSDELPYSDAAVLSIEAAERFAKQFNHPVIGTEHILLGLLLASPNTCEIISDVGVHPDDVRDEIYALLGIERPSQPLSLESSSPAKAPMKVNGFQIRESIKHWTLRREMAIKLFNDEGFIFQDETKVIPAIRAAEVQKADEAVAKLESFQQLFNAAQSVTFNEASITLSQAVKMVAGIGRMENLWKAYASKGLSGQAASRRGYGESTNDVRKDGETHAVRVTPLETCIDAATKFARQQAALRALIASGNGHQIDVPTDLMELFA